MKTYTAKERFELAFQWRYDLPNVLEYPFEEVPEGFPSFEDATLHLLISALCIRGKLMSEFNKLYPPTEDNEVSNAN